MISEFLFLAWVISAVGEVCYESNLEFMFDIVVCDNASCNKHCLNRRVIISDYKNEDSVPTSSIELLKCILV